METETEAEKAKEPSEDKETPEVPEGEQGSSAIAFLLTLFGLGTGSAYATASFGEGIRVTLCLLALPLLSFFLSASIGQAWPLAALAIAWPLCALLFAIRAARLAKKPHDRTDVTTRALFVFMGSFFLLIITAALNRTWAIEPFKIPASSMEPNLKIGDNFFVNKMAYGYWNPIAKQKVRRGPGPQRGDIIVFVYPRNPKMDFVKRVIGLPGDVIEVKNNVLHINEKKALYKKKKSYTYQERESGKWRKERRTMLTETLFGRSFRILLDVQSPSHLGNWSAASDAKSSPKPWGPKVPKGHVFVLGDNRDHSADSREWGLVPIKNIKGRAMFIWLSVGKKGLRWERGNKKIQ